MESEISRIHMQLGGLLVVDVINYARGLYCGSKGTNSMIKGINSFVSHHKALMICILREFFILKRTWFGWFPIVSAFTACDAIHTVFFHNNVCMSY